ncbi:MULTISPECIES: HAD hydrolase-like protein [Reinekea]|jgi:phosphoglycolate phosphatase|uniref:Phosphoglycolate phosphatase n=1 Tax=Reinekea forsetii TaxID=1336806 RepID=A0A2K8KND3_9GAMM|nr:MULTISPECIES: HAD hydrolase-like protein [Reinekea]ATX75599.1 phosphoglycolate phosphatase [Reinekea forsetii]MDO7645736.1 HAD hydrolase-like protein [Reinekea forsetii]
MINILWDLDGTLIDSMAVIARCLNQTSEHFDRGPVPAAQIRSMIGPELGVSLGRILDTQDAEQIQRAKDFYRSCYQYSLHDSPVYPGMLEVLQHCNRIGVRQFIATAKYQLYAEQIIAHSGLAEFFTGIYGSTESGQYGDKKELLAWLLAEEKLKASETLMIGDTAYDVAAGRHHDLTSLGVLWGYSDAPTLLAAGAHQCVAAPEDLMAVIKGSTMAFC